MQKLERARVGSAAVELIQNGFEYGIVGYLRKQCHARAQLEIIGVAHDGGRIGAGQCQKCTGYLDKALSEHGMLNVQDGTIQDFDFAVFSEAISSLLSSVQ